MKPSTAFTCLVFIGLIVFDAIPGSVVAWSTPLVGAEVDPMRNAVSIEICDSSEGDNIGFPRFNFGNVGFCQTRRIKQVRFFVQHRGRSGHALIGSQNSSKGIENVPSQFQIGSSITFNFSDHEIPINITSRGFPNILDSKTSKERFIFSH